MNFTSKYLTEIGWLEIKGNHQEIHSVLFSNQEPSESDYQPEIALKLISQLEDYFKKGEWKFDVNLNPSGTDFQQKVWNELLKIPCGKTISYHELAKNLGDVKRIRAVASANGKNPICLLIPCHRVIGKDGSLTGYAGGIHRKKFLLELEKGIKSLELF